VPEVYAGGVRIHYRLEGAGPPLILQHGFSDSLESWYEFGYVEALSSEYQLVLIDARGHGASDKPHDSGAYGLKRASDVIAVLDYLGMSKTHFYGYSMGGGIGLDLAQTSHERFISIVIGGASPASIDQTDLVTAFNLVLQKDTSAVVDLWESQGSLSPALKKRLLSNDMKALRAVWNSEDFAASEMTLRSCPAPYLLIMGEMDDAYPALLEYSKTLPPGSLVTLSGLNHLQGLQRSDLVLPHLREFLARES
jgi:pimeloyl-ACP methyl ester carboxylesterase